jgi:hypothetical protein
LSFVVFRVVTSSHLTIDSEEHIVSIFREEVNGGTGLNIAAFDSAYQESPTVCQWEPLCPRKGFEVPARILEKHIHSEF